MAIDNMVNDDLNQQEILIRLENDDEYVEDTENEEAELYKLHSMIPYLTSKSPTQLDIVLEAITHINMLQNKLIENLQVWLIDCI